jgi:hypothetical protein
VAALPLARRLDYHNRYSEESMMTRSFLEVLDPDSFVSQFGLVRKPDATVIPDPPSRPDYADVLDHDNLSIEEINDSVLDAENAGVLSRLEYPLPLEPR